MSPPASERQSCLIRVVRLEFSASVRSPSLHTNAANAPFVFDFLLAQLGQKINRGTAGLELVLALSKQEWVTTGERHAQSHGMVTFSYNQVLWDPLYET
jgi:hypothetical protein